MPAWECSSRARGPWASMMRESLTDYGCMHAACPVPDVRREEIGRPRPTELMLCCCAVVLVGVPFLPFLFLLGVGGSTEALPQHLLFFSSNRLASFSSVKTHGRRGSQRFLTTRYNNMSRVGVHTNEQKFRFHSFRSGSARTRTYFIR
eukprot:scaffold93225_cov36-Tisochrysis_lutea.AAC.1